MIIEILKYYYKITTLKSNDELNMLKRHVKLQYPDKKIIKNYIKDINKNYFVKNSINEYKNIFIKIDVNKNYNRFNDSNLVKDIDLIFDKAKDSNIATTIDINCKIDETNNIDMSIFDKYVHNTYFKKSIKLNKYNSEKKVELKIFEHKKLLEVNIFKNINDDVDLQIISPSNVKIQNISPKLKEKEYFIENTKIEIYFNKENNINIKFTSNDCIDLGKWKLLFKPINVEKGNIDIYLKLDDNKIENTLIEGSNLSVVMFRKKLNDFKRTKKREFGDEEVNLDNFMPLFVIDYFDGFEQELARLGSVFKFYKIAENFGILYINKNRIEELGQIYGLENIFRIQRYVKMAQLTTISRDTTNGYVALEEIGANFFKNNPNINIDGRGVIIGIANSGIDYLHPDFIYPDGTSKILYLWDQTIDGNSPEGFNIGTEYTREDINKAIAENNPNLSIDEEGIGTALSGICTGLGNLNDQYKGVAEGSDLVIVKVKKIDGFYNSATLVAATKYIYSKGIKEEKPVVQNINLGSNNSIVRGTDLLVDSLFYEYGICEVIAAGNEGIGNEHATGKIEFIGDAKDVLLEITQEEKELEIDIWINKPDKANIVVISPSGEESKASLVSNFSFVKGLFNIENTYYNIWTTYPFAYSGQQKTVIRLENAKPGIWTIRLIGEYITNGTYHVYLPIKNFLNEGTKFSDSNPEYTITYPATYRDTISVGTYNSIENSLWPDSSRGPIVGATGRIEKPDIIAPGVNIIAPYLGNRYATVTGSGVASAFVTGAVALMMQYTLVDRKYKDKAVVQKIRTYIRAGANRSAQIGYPNVSYGYGILDIRGMFDQLK